MPPYIYTFDIYNSAGVLLNSSSSLSNTYTFTTNSNMGGTLIGAKVSITDSSGTTSNSLLTSYVMVNKVSQLSVTLLTNPSTSGTVNAGQAISFNALVSGGVAPYTYNFYVYNSVTKALLYSSITSSNSISFSANSSLIENTINANVFVTDSEGHTANSTLTVTFSINKAVIIPCHIANEMLQGNCTNAIPAYVAVYTNETSGNLASAPGISSKLGFSSTSWFYLSQPYNSSGLSISADKWHSMVILLNISALSAYVYVDGSYTETVSGISGLLTLESFGTSAKYQYLANNQFYNYTLSLQQISALYGEGIGGLPINIPHLVGWYPLDNSSKDYSGHNNPFIYSNLAFTSSFIHP